MLKLAHQQKTKHHKYHEAALKHKVRNLRAKVQSLLPIHVCQKILRRNNRLKNQLLRKKMLQQDSSTSPNVIYSNEQRKNRWKLTSPHVQKFQQIEWMQHIVQKSLISFPIKKQFLQPKFLCKTDDELYIEDQCECLQDRFDRSKKKHANFKGYHFQKLTDEQIEQIDENKLYYLGQQKHKIAYEQFVKLKRAPKIIVPISNDVYNSVSKSTIAVGTNKNMKFVCKFQTKTSLDSQNTEKYPSRILKHRKPQNQTFQKNFTGQSKNNHKSKEVNNILLKQSRTTTNQKDGWNVNENLARINLEENTKRILLQMQIKSKQQKVEENYYKIKINKKQIREKQNLKEKQKIQTAQQKKRKIHNQTGYIIDLTQKLRKKCIKRKMHLERDQ